MMLIRVTPLPDEGLYQLSESIMIDGHHVPRGFKWNGASIPRLLWTLIDSPFSPALMVPSMMHDYLYHYGREQGVSRKAADKEFKKLLLANGVSKDMADTLYRGVRLGGKSSYR